MAEQEYFYLSICISIYSVYFYLYFLASIYNIYSVKKLVTICKYLLLPRSDVYIIFNKEISFSPDQFPNLPNETPQTKRDENPSFHFPGGIPVP